MGLVGEGGGGGAELVIEKGCVADSQLRLYRKQTIVARKGAGKYSWL